ncbi:MAG: hypothetical protein ACJAV5_000453 [Vicingaceae bacterium]|jgi:hypothetical protein
MFTYYSDPVTLSGTPPSSGWKFYWEPPCCRPNDIENVNTNGSMLLRAIMYPTANGRQADPCFDSSPIFGALPATIICRGSNFSYNHTALDEDLDSLVYRWDRPINPPQLNPQALVYKNGFSPTNPTPDQNININNVPASLNSLTGLTSLAVHSGVGLKKYITVVQVDAYRKSQRIATVYREIPLSIMDCPNLPVGTGVQNNPPQVSINGGTANSSFISITAGQQLIVPIQVTDNDQINIAPFRQEITFTPDGLLFTRSRNGPSQGYPADPVGEPCILSNKDVHPCAYLRNANPFVDQNSTPPVSVIKGLGSISTEFVWQTDCKHIQTNTGFPGTNEGIYNFVMRVQDDHCPVPGINYPTITVKVTDPIPLTEPILKGISVNLDGTTTYSWVPPIDSANQFNPPDRRQDHYESQKAEPSSGQAVSFWQSENVFITNYQQSKRSVDYTPYNLNDVFNPNSGYNILAPKGVHLGQSFDYYLRMRTLSGCTDTNASYWSEPARIMELQASPAGIVNSRDSVLLNWNRATQLNARTYPYLTYESATHYYIYANDFISNGGVADSSNWYLTGSTKNTSFVVSTGNCSDYSAYRVQARDTVVTIKHGSSVADRPIIESLDTLYFSTFSTVDSIFVTGGAPSVLNVGKQYLQSSVQREKYQWIDCATNQLLVNDTQFTFRPTTPGFYKVVASNSNCSDTSSCYEVKPVKDTIFSVGIQNLEARVQGVLINWVNCADSSIVGNASGSYVPTEPGSYRVSYQKFGYPISYTDCFTVAPLDSTVVQYQFDFFEAKDSMANYKWYQKLSQVDILMRSERNRTFVPRSEGSYYAELSKYGFFKISEEVIAPELNINVIIASNQELVSADSGKYYRWKDCNTDMFINGETNRNLLLTDTGNFAVRVGAFNYWKYSDCIEMNAVSLLENSFQSQLNYYPNPTNGLVQIDFTQMQNSITVEVYSIQGKLVQTENFRSENSFEINLNQPSGIYFIQLTNERGERANLKVVKQ